MIINEYKIEANGQASLTIVRPKAINSICTFLVDAEDVPKLKLMKWTFIFNAHKKLKVRAISTTKPLIHMSRYLSGMPAGLVVDHISGDTKDNRKCNLRTVSKKCNNQNLSIPCNNTSGFRGATYDYAKRLWMSNVTSDGRTIFLGYYDTAEEAGKVASAYRFYFFEGAVEEQPDIPKEYFCQPGRRRIRKDSSSGVRGLSYSKVLRKWVFCRIQNKKRIMHKYFKSFEEAIAFVEKYNNECAV